MGHGFQFAILTQPGWVIPINIPIVGKIRISITMKGILMLMLLVIYPLIFFNVVGNIPIVGIYHHERNPMVIPMSSR